MKGSYQRYVDRELNRARTANENQMLRYQETLKKVADAVGTTVPFKIYLQRGLSSRYAPIPSTRFGAATGRSTTRRFT